MQLNQPALLLPSCLANFSAAVNLFTLFPPNEQHLRLSWEAKREKICSYSTCSNFRAPTLNSTATLAQVALASVACLLVVAGKVYSCGVF